ncbi:MAG: patatin-like phospholipase family protein [Sphaerochaeta sp.]|nr:patatin-like phospholipase family protein [Sphaerochaeta sp.]
MKRILVICVTLLFSLSVSATPLKVALVLSGGGARGLAHIAVLETIEKFGIPVDMVLGTSMGSLVGALYCAGYSPGDIRTLIEDTDLVALFTESPIETPQTVAKAFVPSKSNVLFLGFGEGGIGTAPGLIGDQRILELLTSTFSRIPDDISFDDLEIPFRCVGTDAVSGERIVYDEGSIIKAVRSSISLPIIFTPYPQGDGSYAMDGGLVDNLPIQLAKDLGADIVIACDVNALQRLMGNELNSLSAVAMQTILLVAQASVVPQYASADLLIFPDLGNVLDLDFFRYEHILAQGEKACEAREAEFRDLASRILLQRDLNVKDSSRKGAYYSLPDPIIRDVVVVDLSNYYDPMRPKKEDFNKYLQRPLDDQTKLELSHTLSLLRSHYRLSTASYQIGLVEEGEGTLFIMIRSFEESSSSISLGVSGTMGFSNNIPNGYKWFKPEATLNASISHLMDSNFTLEMQVSLGEVNLLDIGAFYPFAITPTNSLDIQLSFRYLGGAFSPLNTLVNGEREAALDQGFDLDLGLRYHFWDYGRADFGGIVKMVYLHSDAWNPHFLSIPSLYTSIVWDTQKTGFASRGIHAEFEGSLGYFHEALFGLRSSVNQMFAVGSKDAIGYDVKLSMMRLAFPLLTSYVDFGGLDGMSGYSVGSLKRDIALAGLIWQHNVGEVIGFPAIVQAAAKFGFFDSYDPYSAIDYAQGSYLSDSPIFDVGVNLLLGLSTPIGEFVVSMGTSMLGNISFTLGVL